jgi:hypothetical protein
MVIMNFFYQNQSKKNDKIQTIRPFDPKYQLFGRLLSSFGMNNLKDSI